MGGSFKSFQFTDQESSNPRQVKWVPKNGQRALPVSPEPVGSGSQGTWTNDPNSPEIVDEMDQCDVYTSETGAEGTWTKYSCSWPLTPPPAQPPPTSVWKQIDFQTQADGTLKVTGSNDDIHWFSGNIGPAQENQTPPA